MATLYKPKKKRAFDAQVFLESVGASRKVIEFRENQAIFSQVMLQRVSCMSKKGV
jgi:hypothetical protein